MPSPRPRPSVLIIGGGVAGASCAISLRSLGIAVDVAEKAAFPRPKVCGCCIGGTGLSMLDRLGVRDEAVAAGARTDRWSASLGGRIVDIPLPNGLAISREVLDPLLVEHARRRGVDVTMETTARIIDLNDKRVEVSWHEVGCDAVLRSYDIVVVAAGLKAGGISEILPWTKTPSGPFGVSMEADCDDVRTGVIYMACDDDGYVGLVRMANGRVDVAGALRRGSRAADGRSPLDRVKRLLAQSHFDFSELRNPSPTMTTPPLRRSRTSGKGRVIAIGDAAGYVEPFTGEGMTWAMQTGAAAARTISNQLETPNDLGVAWDRVMRGLLRSEKRMCRLVTTTLRSSFARHVAANALTLFPALARPIVRGLNRPA